MATGDKADKNLKIEKFENDVIIWAVAKVNKTKINANAAYRSGVPFVEKGDIDMKPSDLSGIGEKSSVKTIGGEITAAALADLFLSYGRNLTCIRKCHFQVRQQRTSVARGLPAGYTSYVTQWNDVTALSQNYAMSPTAFRDKVADTTDPANPVAALAPGNFSQEAAIDKLILKIKNVISANMNDTATVSITVCHSACHSSCHGSRGRR